MNKGILRALMDPSRPDAVPWTSSELREMLEHQLSVPLASDFPEDERINRCPPGVAPEPQGTLRDSFADILRADPPNPWALRMIKDFAKESLTGEGGLPRDVARVIYVLAILRARQLKVGEISSLDAVNLKKEVYRCLTFGWIPDTVRQWLTAGMLDT